MLAVTQTAIAVFAAVAGFALFSEGMAKLPEAIAYASFLLATVLIGGLTGFQFSQSSQLQRGNFAATSGKTYSFDLIGSAFGALAVSIFLVPKLGIVGSVWLIAGINLIFAAWLFLKTKVRI